MDTDSMTTGKCKHGHFYDTCHICEDFAEAANFAEAAKPVKPPENTQNWEILAYMQTYGQITPLDALEVCWCMRLSQRIIELEALGWNISHQWVRLPSGKRVMGYSLR